MMLDEVLDIAVWVALLSGAFLTMAAGVGLLRFPDVVSRMHAATKPQILGLMLVVLAVAIQARSWGTLLALIPVILFQMITAPISAHMVGRAAYRSDNVRKDMLSVDELGQAESALDGSTSLPRVTDKGGPERHRRRRRSGDSQEP